LEALGDDELGLIDSFQRLRLAPQNAVDEKLRVT
jgi:hypothetical protein